MVKEFFEAAGLRTMLAVQLKDMFAGNNTLVSAQGLEIRRTEREYIIDWPSGKRLTVAPRTLGSPTVILRKPNEVITWDINGIKQLQDLNDLLASIRGNLV